MGILVGASWLLYWLLTDGLSVQPTKALVITGVVFVLIGLVYETKPWVKRA